MDSLQKPEDVYGQRWVKAGGDDNEWLHRK